MKYNKNGKRATVKRQAVTANRENLTSDSMTFMYRDVSTPHASI
jgi:uncharacterized protein YccT (UPF0319 family)